MAGAFVQHKGSSTGGSSVSVTLDSTPAVGSLLVGALSHRSHLEMGGISVPGWTQREFSDENLSGTVKAYVYTRVSDGSAGDTFAASWTNGNNTWAVIAEYSGLDAIAPFENSGEDAANISSFALTCDTGSATPISANGLAIAVLCGYQEGSWGLETTAIDSGFTIDASGSAGGSRPLVVFASKVYTSTAAQSAQWSTTESGTPNYGAMLVFKEPAGAGAVSHPSLIRSRNHINQLLSF